jgi:adenylate kinase
MERPTSAQKIKTIKDWLGTGSINLFGMPFAGKDTHGRELAESFGGVLIGGGDIIRSSKELAHIKEHVDSGALAPTEEYLRIILPYFERPEFKDKPLILSSVGRWHGEEAGVLEATAASGHPLLAVIFLKIDHEELIRRWKAAEHVGDRGQRHDDAEHVLDKRLDEFRTKTIPVIDFYRDQGMLIEVDGMAPQDEVSQLIIDQLWLRARSA